MPSLTREQASTRAEAIKQNALASKAATTAVRQAEVVDQAPVIPAPIDNAAMQAALSASSDKIADAEQILRSLITARGELGGQEDKLTTEREKIAYAAIGDGDPKAKTRLASIHTVLAQLGSEIAAHDAAIREAKERVAAAKQQHDHLLGKARAAEGLAHLDTLAAAGHAIDAALRQFVDACHQLETAAQGVALATGHGPTAEQVNSALRRVLPTALIPFKRTFDLPAPPRPEQRTASDWTSAWAAAARHSLLAVIGPKED